MKKSINRLSLILSMTILWGLAIFSNNALGQTSVMVGTGQVHCYDQAREIRCPQPGQPFYGQDAQYKSNRPAYKDNGDGTVTDLNTGLMWSKAVDKRKVSLSTAEKNAQRMWLGGYSDWRVPNIKELYSLIDFRGNTGFNRGGSSTTVPANAIPYINTDYFDFAYGDVNAGERVIDAQWLSSTQYVSTTMKRMATLFGVNFADGRIKGYGYKPLGAVQARKKFFVRYVRGKDYGKNHFLANGNGTVTDQATGLTWMQKDSGQAMNWQQALKFAEDLVYAGYDDWRLPNAKELQYLIDYSRAPDTTGTPAIEPVFQTTSIVNEARQKDYPYFWTSTTHLAGPSAGANGVYLAFGRALGKMRGKIMDVHGAGAQRSDPKTGSATVRGPQGDIIRVKNYVRCVRGEALVTKTPASLMDRNHYPNNINNRSASSNSLSGGGALLDRSGQGTGQAGENGLNGMTRPSFGPLGFVERLDKNGDGKVSRSEFDGPKDRFAGHDRNKDGYLTEEEAPKGPPPRGGQPPRSGR